MLRLSIGIPSIRRGSESRILASKMSNSTARDRMVQQQRVVFVRFENVESGSGLTSDVDGTVGATSHNTICAFDLVGCDLAAVIGVTVAYTSRGSIEVELKLSGLPERRKTIQ